MTTALVTGASAGLGAEFARQLAAKKYDLILVARSKDRLDSLAASLTTAHGIAAEVLVADLSTTKGTDAVAKRLSDAARPVDLLVNNAGLGQGKDFLDNDLEAELSSLDVMVRAILVLSHAAGRAMVERGHGAIINVSSVATWLGYGTYSAAKAWVTSFTEGLAGQLRGTGVTATAVLPGLTHTEFHERAGIGEYTSVPESGWLKAEDVVAAALKANAKGRVLVTPSVRYGTLAWIARVSPRAWTRAVARGNR